MTRARTILPVAAVITVSFLGSVLVTPLYILYQRKFGFSEITLTLVYSVYTVGNLAALAFFGQISDQLGRKRVALPALGVAVLGALSFLFATGTAWLYAGRALIGLAVGIASGTGTAWLAELFGPDSRTGATLTASTANLVGIAAGPLIGGLLAEYARWPLHLSFVVYLALVLAVAAAVARVKDPPRGRLADVRVHPRIGVPRELFGRFAAPAVTGFATFAVGGLYFALIPGIVVRDLHHDNVALGGLIVFELATIAALLIVAARRIPAGTAMTIGLVLLIPAVALIVGAQAAHSMPLLVLATACAGGTLSLGYRGSLQLVNDMASDDRRAEVASSYFIACFVGNSVPVIGIGVLSTHVAPLTASVVFAIVVAALALGALAGQRRTALNRSRRPSVAGV